MNCEVETGAAGFLWRFVDSIIYGAYLFDVQNGINVKQKISIKFTTQQAPGTTSRRSFVWMCIFLLFFLYFVWCENILSLLFSFYRIPGIQYSIRSYALQSRLVAWNGIKLTSPAAYICMLFSASCAPISSNLRVMILWQTIRRHFSR